MAENKLDGSPAYKVIDGDNMLVIRIFHGEARKEMLDFYTKLYGSVSEDHDGDIICYKDAEDEDY